MWNTTISNPNAPNPNAAKRNSQPQHQFQPPYGRPPSHPQGQQAVNPSQYMQRAFSTPSVGQHPPSQQNDEDNKGLISNPFLFHVQVNAQIYTKYTKKK